MFGVPVLVREQGLRNRALDREVNKLIYKASQNKTHKTDCFRTQQIHVYFFRHITRKIMASGHIVMAGVAAIMLSQN
jgi:hypothetical protein